MKKILITAFITYAICWFIVLIFTIIAECMKQHKYSVERAILWRLKIKKAIR